MRLMKRPESLVDELAAVLIAPAILWILVVCWVFGGNRGARKAYLWMFAERDSSNKSATCGGPVAGPT